MIVFIPTYKRTNCIRWVLISLLQARVPVASKRLLICVVNNHPLSKTKVHHLVDDVVSHNSLGPWEIKIIDREKTLEPINNWYSAITDLADEEEVIFLHGDDDLFLPWSLDIRNRSINDSEADMLLSDSIHGLVFLPDEKSIYYPEYKDIVQKKNVYPQPVKWSEIAGWGPAFICNHCYRYTESFYKALMLSFEWCHQQDWLDCYTRTLMLTYYLPFAIKHVGGKLYGIRQECVIRGKGYEETRKAPYGVPGWNSGFMALCAYGVFNNQDLYSNTEIQNARIELASMAFEWYCTFFFDKRIPLKTRKETLKKIRIPGFSVFSRSFLRSIKKVIFDKLAIDGIRTKRRLFNNKQSITDFLNLLKDIDR